MFRNRQEAGYKLSQAWKQLHRKFDIVLAIPRGGVVVGDEIAHDFDLPLDVVLAKKIGSPNLPEYAIGAVAPDGEILLHKKELLKEVVNSQEIDFLAAKVKEEINYRLDIYRGSKAALNVAGKKVLLVDDGIATGFTIKAAIHYLRRLQASQVLITAPVSSINAYHEIKETADYVLVLEIPEKFYAVGQFYEDFSEIDDKQVIYILKQY
ncbi:MAG TPA: phosphoribosyltransferase family protein [Syntrophomonadaceae bacterium]|jgi:putative phosphoribosyl transferase|nr:phosphoribosyltransferase family protein [Syntrophomonadaceae bacterium]HRX20802.1 phosphoribosyltransferase family protein [Syntrophomonadaceae bacterium]